MLDDEVKLTPGLPLGNIPGIQLADSFPRMRLNSGGYLGSGAPFKYYRDSLQLFKIVPQNASEKEWIARVDYSKVLRNTQGEIIHFDRAVGGKVYDQILYNQILTYVGVSDLYLDAGTIYEYRTIYSP